MNDTIQQNPFHLGLARSVSSYVLSINRSVDRPLRPRRSIFLITHVFRVMPPESLPEDILFLIIRACVPSFEFIYIKRTEQRDSTASKVSRRPFHPNGLPDIVDLKLANKSIHDMAESCLHNQYGGGLRLDAIDGNLERSIVSHDSRLRWIIPRITHLSFPIHFQDLDKLNHMLGNGINLPNLRTIHIEWQMRIPAWHLTNVDDVNGVHLNRFVEQTVKAERQRKVSIGRYVDILREILGDQEGFRLTVDYVVELGHRTRHDIYHQFTVDVTTSESVVVAHKPVPT